MANVQVLPELATGTVTSICFWAGLILLAVGTLIGLILSLKSSKLDAGKKVEDAKKNVDDAAAQASTAAQEIKVAGNRALEADGPVDVTSAAAAADSAASSAAAAKTALEQVQGVLGALPEHLRFAGLLIIVGTVLIGVATVQYGGTSLF